MQVDLDPDGKAGLSACCALVLRSWDVAGFARALLESDQQRSGDCFCLELVPFWLLLLPGEAIVAMVRAATATEPLSGPLLGGHMVTIHIRTN